jgi:signal transduction histidine kinase
MAVIQGQVDVLSMELEDARISMPDELRASINKSMEYILEARERVSGMIRAIQDYSSKTSGEFVPVMMDEVYDGYWKLFGSEFQRAENKSVEYVKEIAPNLPCMLGDRIELEHIFFNFPNNALYAVKRSEIKKIEMKIFRKNDDWIRIEYLDTGIGIDQSIIKDIFLAHVTTKGSAEGTGLGLFRVRKIVELHDGKVWAESEGAGKGAAFIVEFPVFKGDVKSYLKDIHLSLSPKRGF